MMTMTEKKSKGPCPQPCKIINMLSAPSFSIDSNLTPSCVLRKKEVHLEGEINQPKQSAPNIVFRRGYVTRS